MDGWIYGWMNGKKDWWLDRWMDGQQVPHTYCGLPTKCFYCAHQCMIVDVEWRSAILCVGLNTDSVIRKTFRVSGSNFVCGGSKCTSISSVITPIQLHSMIQTEMKHEYFAWEGGTIKDWIRKKTRRQKTKHSIFISHPPYLLTIKYLWLARVVVWAIHKKN